MPPAAAEVRAQGADSHTASVWGAMTCAGSAPRPIPGCRCRSSISSRARRGMCAMSGELDDRLHDARAAHPVVGVGGCRATAGAGTDAPGRAGGHRGPLAGPALGVPSPGRHDHPPGRPSLRGRQRRQSPARARPRPRLAVGLGRALGPALVVRFVARRRPPLAEQGPSGRSPDRIRTGATALRGRRPRPLDDGAGQRWNSIPDVPGSADRWGTRTRT